MKTPPLLLGAALVFWGWQVELPAVGVTLAIVLEGARLLRSRWEFSDDEFRRIWIFSCLVFVAALFYAFNANEGPADFSRMFQDPNFAAQTRAGTAGARTMISMIRWSPMIFFLFMAAQTYSTSTEVPVATVSIFMWRRRKRALKLGASVAGEKKFNLSYPYFGTCLLAASIHTNDVTGYFWGFCALMAWALWLRRSRRLNPVAWATILAMVIALGDIGQSGLNRLQQFISNNSAQWLSQFFERDTNPMQNATAIGDIGRINASGKIVIRLETKPDVNPPLYLREASYRYYHNQIWFASKGGFDSIPEERTNTGIWLLLPEKTNKTEVNIACYLPGSRALLPLPTGSGRLEHLPAYTLGKNSEGAVLAEGPGLVIFDAHYGPGATMDSPVRDIDFDIPTNELPALREITNEMQIGDLSPPQKLQRVQAFFQNNFTYSTWQDGPVSGRTNDITPLSRFLLQTRSGHCEYFATATVFLLRLMHVPARYAVGYAVHEAHGNKYLVRLRDGHAWCLVWDEKTRTWYDFDTTPASRFAEEAKRASAFEWLSDAWSRVRFEIAKFWWGQGDIRKYVLWALIPILLLLLYQIVFRRSWRRRERTSRAENELFNWPGADSEFYQLERRLAGFIGARGRNETVGNWLERAAEKPTLRNIIESLKELLRLHYRYRFDPAGLIPQDRELLKETVRECLRRLSEPELSHK